LYIILYNFIYFYIFIYETFFTGIYFLQAIKCGYCGRLVFGSCTEFKAHQCFQNYDENIHVIFIDKTGRAILSIFFYKNIFYDLFENIKHVH